MSTANPLGKYQPYPEYKNSGVEWLGDVPKQWIPTRLKYISYVNMGQSPSSEDCNDVGNGVPFLQGNAEFGQTTPSPKQFCEVAKKNAKPGDFLFSVRAPVGAVNIANQLYGIGRGLCAIRPNGDVMKGYLWWILQISKVQFDAISTGSTFDAVSAEQVNNFSLALPPRTEQKIIAAFLDYETARIDQLIAKQQQLIELLKEKRQAVISHAVTKGLNPNAPMKDSGVEWLGQVPEHWEVAKLRRFILEHRQGYYTTDSYVDDGVKLLRITDLRELGNVDFESCPLVPKTPSLVNFTLKKGDVVFARTGGAGSFGVIDELEHDIVYASYLIRFRFKQKHFIPSYLRFLFLSDSFQLAIKQNIHGGVNQNIHAEDIKDAFITMPPVDEQQRVANILTTQMESFSELLAISENSIKLMTERRTALISAAVTGKIDLRGCQPPKREVAA